MNERIRELAKQADPDYTGEYDDDMGHALVGNDAIQKFADLIIQECLQLCKDAQTAYLMHGMPEREADGAISV